MNDTQVSYTPSRLELIGTSTLTGGIYGLIGGLATGGLFGFQWAMMGGFIGLSTGLLYGLINGGALHLLERYMHVDTASDAHYHARIACTVITSLLLTVGVAFLPSGGGYLGMASVWGFPLIVLSATLLAEKVSRMYY